MRRSTGGDGPWSGDGHWSGDGGGTFDGRGPRSGDDPTGGDGGSTSNGRGPRCGDDAGSSNPVAMDDDATDHMNECRSCEGKFTTNIFSACNYQAMTTISLFIQENVEVALDHEVHLVSSVFQLQF